MSAFTERGKPPLPSFPLDPSAVYWLKQFDCLTGWETLTHRPDASWERLVRCDDPDDAPLIAVWYKQQGGIGVWFLWTDRDGAPHHA